MSGPLRHLREELRRLEQQGLLRSDAPRPIVGVDFCSNDYLDRSQALAKGPGATSEIVSRETSTRPPPRPGAGASRLVAGDMPSHRALERGLSDWLGTEATLLFSSGYAANLGTLAALVSPGDLVVSDALNHASIIDGCRLGRASVHVYRHLDVKDAAGALKEHRQRSPEARRWLVTESYFSMDADGPDLAALRAVCDQEDAALVVDEAHSLGAFGGAGRGLLDAAGVRADVFIGMLGKAFGTAGGFVSGDRPLIQWLWNRARSFVFSTGMSPLVAEASLDSLHFLASANGARAALARNATRLREGLAGIAPGELRVLGHGHVIPVSLVRAPEQTMPLAEQLRAAGFWVQGIRPPTVATARIRLTTRAGHTEAEIDSLVAAFRQCYKRLTG